MPEHFFADTIRAANIGLWALILGQSISVLWSYTKAWRTVRKRAHRDGLLPLHVVSVSVAFNVLAAEAAWRTVQRVDHPIVGWTLINTFVFLLSNLALWAVFRFERRRIVEYKPVTVVRLPGETLVLDDRKAVDDLHNGPYSPGRRVSDHEDWREDDLT